MLAWTTLLGALCASLVIAQDPCLPSVYIPLPNEFLRGFDIPRLAVPQCDQILAVGWYRINLDLALTRPLIDRCGTVNTIWMNDPIPDVNDGIIPRTVCVNRGSGVPCQVSAPIRVKNCGAFRVYELNLPLDCPTAYCVNAETADLTTSVEPPTTTTELLTTTTESPTTTTEPPTTTTEPPTTTTEPPTTTTEPPTTTTTEPPTTTDPFGCIDTTYRPWISNIEDCGTCDLRNGACTNPLVDVTPRSPVYDSASLECRYREIRINEEGPCLTGPDTIVPAVYQSCVQVTCPLPASGIPTLPGRMLVGYLISVSNENQEWGSESLYIPHDPTCVTCTTCSSCLSGNQLPNCTWAADNCVIDGRCYANGYRDLSTFFCKICNTSRSTTQWSPVPGFCLGSDDVCHSEGLGPSTAPCAVCNSANTQFDLTVTAGQCFIDSQCVPAGTADPMNNCLACEPAISQTNYTSGAGVCNVAGVCYVDGESIAGDPCRVCRPTVSTTSLIVDANWCFIGGVCIAENQVNPGNGCEVCLSATSQSAYSTAVDICTIGGACYANGASDPTSVCQVCDTSRNLSGFVLAPDYCFINDVCYATGTGDISGAQCSGCNPLIDTMMFTTTGNVFIIQGGSRSCAEICSYYTTRSRSLLPFVCGNADLFHAQGRDVLFFRDVCVVSDHNVIRSLNCFGIGTLLNSLANFCSFRGTNDLRQACQ